VYQLAQVVTRNSDGKVRISGAA